MEGFIQLQAIGRRVTIRQYIDAVKREKAHPDAVFKHGLSSWWPVTGRQIVREFLAGVQDRINQKGRKAP